MNLENPLQPCNSSPSNVTTDIQRAAAAIQQGDLVAFATETVYGLGANALDEAAVARIFAAKNRPEFDPLIVHVASLGMLDQLVCQVSPIARALADRFWPGPLTIVMPKRATVPDLVTSGLPTVGVRLPAHEQARRFLQACNRPVAAPSANPFGRISPTTAQHVIDGLGDAVDFILDGGPCTVGVESTVLSVVHERPILMRHGGVTQESIEELIGPIQVLDSVSPQEAAHSPGQLPSHYAPHTKLVLLSDITRSAIAQRKSIAGFAFDTESSQRLLESVGVPLAELVILSPRGDLTEATARFFSELRRLDDSNADLIVATEFPHHSLGKALNDRIRRAAY